MNNAINIQLSQFLSNVMIDELYRQYLEIIKLKKQFYERYKNQNINGSKYYGVMNHYSLLEDELLSFLNIDMQLHLSKYLMKTGADENGAYSSLASKIIRKEKINTPNDLYQFIKFDIGK